MILGLMSDIHTHRGDHSTEVARLLDSINNGPAPDLLLFAGDVSHRIYEIDQFLKGIKLNCPKCWVPGNHDIWVIDRESPDDTSDHRYREVFPGISRDAGWHYLPENPLVLSNIGIGIVGTIGWFSGDGYDTKSERGATCRGSWCHVSGYAQHRCGGDRVCMQTGSANCGWCIHPH